MQSGIYQGFVRHRRFSPVAHEFRTSLFMMYLDLAELPSLFAGRWFWSVERPNIASFYRRDHFGDPQKSLDQTVRDLVESKLQSRPDGPIRLLTHLRYFGYCFNPLSIYFCFDSSGQRLHSLVAEVTNTPWGQRHCYVLPASGQVGDSSEEALSRSGSLEKNVCQFDKVFHVSPFMEMNVEYLWTLRGPGNKLVLHAENRTDGETFFDATLTMDRKEINSWSLMSVLCRYPLMTGQVIANIYWQAFRLWRKQLPYVPHPDPQPIPKQETSSAPVSHVSHPE